MIRNIFFAVTIIGLASCQKEVKVDVPEHNSSLVINSSSEVGDSIEVQVSKTVGIVDKKGSGNQVLSNAAVTLFADGVPVEVLKYETSEGIYKSNTIAQTGKSYKVRVAAPGFTDAEATTATPAYVPIKSLQKIDNARLDIDGNQLDEIRIEFDDPPGIGDYYILSFTGAVLQDSFGRYSDAMVCAYTNDASIESVYNEEIDQNVCIESNAIFFRDALFNGTTKEFRLYVNKSYTQPYLDTSGEQTTPMLTLYHVPEAYFKYMKSYKFATSNADNPFSEPTNVYTNVTNGYGIFGIVSSDTKQVK
jgi:hypothetical protein